MNKYLSILFFLMTLAQSFGQIHGGCGTKGIIRHTEHYQRPGDPGPVDTDISTPYVMNVFFTLIKDNLNQTVLGDELDTDTEVENRFLECTRILNVRFNPYNLYFKYTGFQIKNSDAFYGQSDNQWSDFSAYRQENTMNLYFVNAYGYMEGTDATVAAAVLGGTESLYLTYGLGTNAYNQEYLDRTLVHQIGHNLSLYHTHEAESHLDPEDLLYNNSDCEHVTRDENDPDYNADYAGDEVTDTPAQPYINESSFPLDCSPITPTGTNCFLENYPSDVVKNYMNIGNSTFDTTCPWVFTTGQIKRMRDYIKYNTADYQYLGTNSARTDVATLYEPFDAQVITGAIVSTTDDPENGGAIVCRNQIYKMRFQPGYRQKFYNTANGTVTVEENEQFNYENGFDTAIGVKIPSINNEIRNTGVISSVNNLACNFESYVSGTVYSMAVLGQMNMSVRELNEIEVKDPALYNSLMAQYYYIFKKITTSGAQTQQTFYKP